MPRRTSNAQKRMRGTWKPSRDRETEPSETPILPPQYLTEPALRVWRLKAPSLQAEGLLTPLDAENFALWCAMTADLEATLAAGNLPTRDFMAHYRPLSAAFGLNPDARSKLGHESPQKPKGSKYDDV